MFLKDKSERIFMEGFKVFIKKENIFFIRMYWLLYRSNMNIIIHSRFLLQKY